MENNGNLEPTSSSSVDVAIETFEANLTSFLQSKGLPISDILVPIKLRLPVFQNMDTALAELTNEQRADSVYISKFGAACAAGLFDAALNYLWNETVKNLREKVSRFDLEYFFDTVGTDPGRRKNLQEAADLEKLADWELIRGCKQTGIITDNGFRHLDYIRDMRNHASAAHPNQINVTGLQIIGWLETCIREVLSKEPVGPVVEIRRLLNNLRNEQLSEKDLPAISAGVEQLPQEQAGSLLRAILGMYADPNVSAQVKDNVRLVAKTVWAAVSDERRHEAGLKQATHTANGDSTRANLTREFIEIVEGLEYLADATRSLELSTALDNLLTAHEGWHNFYAEPIPAQMLLRIVPKNGSVPSNVLSKYVRTITMCRMGNGYGVAWGARDTYDELLDRFSDEQIRTFVNLLHDSEVVSRLQFRSCVANFQAIAESLNSRAVRPRIKAMLTFIQNYPQLQLKNMAEDSNYLQLRQTLQV